MARRPRRTIGSLDARSDAILRAVIDEYVTSATPVSSGSLVEHYPLGVSSATVRNILSDLEALGLLTHPHTSAGRVPTDAGYRYYVQVLADEWSLPPVEQRMIRHQFGQVEFASEHWFRLAASTLAANTGTAGLATTAKPRAVRVRRVDLVTVQDRLALLVVLFREGNTKQTLANLPVATDQEQLDRVAGLLNVLAVDRTADEIAAALTDLPAGEESSDDLDLLHRIGDGLVRTMREFDAALIDDLFSDGLLNVMAAPGVRQERQGSGRLRRPGEPGLPRLPGRERRPGRQHPDLHRPREQARWKCRRSRSSWRRTVGSGTPSAWSASSGPTRMPYAQAIASVEFVSGLMNELVEHLYA